MKVLDLQCQSAHAFEGWFGSEDDFQSQLARGLVQCPMCGDACVHKMLSAPRLNLGAIATKVIANNTMDTPASELKSTKQPAAVADLTTQAEWMQMARNVIAQTDDVGTEFAEQARKMHYGEVKPRGIRGQASKSETLELIEEGIAVQPLLLPDAFKETLQ